MNVHISLNILLTLDQIVRIIKLLSEEDVVSTKTIERSRETKRKIDNRKQKKLTVREMRKIIKRSPFSKMSSGEISKL